MFRRACIGLTSLLLTTGPHIAAQAPAGQDGFRPASELPPGQELPAAPLVIASYAFFLLLMIFYLWTIWRRIGKVEKDIHELERRQGSSPR
jgi:hypothetical protein